LAKQFIEIGEMQSARSMLEEVVEKGSPQLRTQAKDLLAKLK
jgi:FimV-like protein